MTSTDSELLPVTLEKTASARYREAGVALDAGLVSAGVVLDVDGG